MKKLFAILIAVVMLLSLAACGADEPAKEEGGSDKVVIGLLVYNDKNEFIQKVVAGAQAKCDEYGYELITYSADGDAAKEVCDDIRGFIAGRK